MSSLARGHSSARTLIPATSIAVVLTVLFRYYLLRRKRATDAALMANPSNTARRIRGPGDQYDFDEYDVIIVGGGSAGCVLAARLSEDPAIRVLVLEAGVSSIAITNTIIPAAFLKLFRTEHEWGMDTVPQTSADGEPRFWPRAKLLGGCTCMNAMCFQCGAPEDYDEWARLQKGQEGASGWTSKEFDPYFKKFEKYNPSPDHPNVNPAYRGQNGVVQTGLFSHTAEVTSRFIESCVKIGIQRVPDLNTPAGTMGVSKVLTYITSNGRRSTAQSAYLTEEVLARPNLTVLTHAQVTRILFDNSGSVPRAVGAEFTRQNGEKYQVKARKEVVMSAGAIHTPHILMLSGVGPAGHLAEHNIPVVADLPGVGSHLKDHVVVDINLADKTQTSLSYLVGLTLPHKLRAMKALLQWSLTGKGPLVSNGAEAIGFLRSTDPALFAPNEFPPEEIEDTSSGPGAPDIEIFTTPYGYLKHGTVKFSSSPSLGLHAVVLRPKSSGTIRLKSNNPSDSPVIDPRYLSHSNDIVTLTRGLRLLIRLTRTEPIASTIDPAGDNLPEFDHHVAGLDDASLVQYIKRRVETLYHPACTARMAPLEDGGVVDTHLRVHGIPNLRVADASVFPTIVSGHTTAATLAVAEKAADMIKTALSSKANA